MGHGASVIGPARKTSNARATGSDKPALQRELWNLVLFARESWSKGNRPWAAVTVALAATAISLMLHESALAPTIWHSGAVYASLPLGSELLRLPMSLFLPTPYLPEWGAVAQLLIVIGLGELILGRWFTVAVAVIAQGVATLTARGLIDGGHAKFIGLPISLSHVLDTGPSAATVAVGVCLLIAVRDRWLASILCASLVAAALISPGLDGTEHAVALVCGLVGGSVHCRFLPGGREVTLTGLTGPGESLLPAWLWHGARRDFRIRAGIVQRTGQDGHGDGSGLGAAGIRAAVVVPLKSRERADDEPDEQQR
jgi:hypothetical protein